MLRIAVSGFATGLLLQIAIGPVFFYILNLALQKTLLDGLFAVIAVTTVDYIYISLAVLGVGRLLENARVKTILGILSSIVLAVFGAFMINSTLSPSTTGISTVSFHSDYSKSFISAFILTLSSPLTIVFWTSLFASKSIEKGYHRGELMIFGFSAGLATLVFLGISSTVLSFLKTSLPAMLITILNACVGATLVLYGVIRLSKLLVSCRAGSN